MSSNSAVIWLNALLLLLAAAACTPVDEVRPSTSLAADGGEADGAAARANRDAEAQSGGSGRDGQSSSGGPGRGDAGRSDADGGKSESSGGSGDGSDGPAGRDSGASDPSGNGSSGSGASDSGSPVPSCSEEICDGLDNDCDGVVDEELVRECGPNPAQGACKAGSETCSAGAWSACAGAIEPVEELCDAAQVDEDCDGSGNEGCACENGAMEDCTGNDTGPCSPGTRMCVDGKWSMCMGATAPAAEVCDGADNDCDGTLDDNTTDCARSETCRGGRCECVPNCTNKACGSNGCGGMCPDTCGGNTRCNVATSTCECTPQCSGKECGPDGCDGVCRPDNCAGGETCSSAGQCVNNCGNSRTDSGEECDDGNADETDGCIACQNAQCGDGFVQANVEECEVFGGEWAGKCTSQCVRTVYYRCPDGTTCSSGDVCASTTGNASQAMCTSTNCGACPAATGYVASCNFGHCMMHCNPGRTCPSRMACIPFTFVDPMSGTQTMQDICVPRVE